MRIAVISDIHGNLTALEAVLADLRTTAPDLVLHGGDLADSGSRPAEVVDQIRDLGWAGVMGNADEMYTRPESLDEFARQSSAPQLMWTALREMATSTRGMLGQDRISWMRDLPRTQVYDSMVLLHASPTSVWRSPGADATDAALEETYSSLGGPLVTFGHIHKPFVRAVPTGTTTITIANSGSVGLPFDGDCRASYLLIDNLSPSIRRVSYDVEKEVQLLEDSGLPHSDWIARMLRSAAPQLP